MTKTIFKSTVSCRRVEGAFFFSHSLARDAERKEGAVFKGKWPEPKMWGVRVRRWERRGGEGWTIWV